MAFAAAMAATLGMAAYTWTVHGFEDSKKRAQAIADDDAYQGQLSREALDRDEAAFAAKVKQHRVEVDKAREEAHNRPYRPPPAPVKVYNQTPVSATRPPPPTSGPRPSAPEMNMKDTQRAYDAVVASQRAETETPHEPVITTDAGSGTLSQLHEVSGATHPDVDEEVEPSGPIHTSKALLNAVATIQEHNNKHRTLLPTVGHEARHQAYEHERDAFYAETTAKNQNPSPAEAERIARKHYRGTFSGLVRSMHGVDSAHVENEVAASAREHAKAHSVLSMADPHDVHRAIEHTAKRLEKETWWWHDPAHIEAMRYVTSPVRHKPALVTLDTRDSTTPRIINAMCQRMANIATHFTERNERIPTEYEQEALATFTLLATWKPNVDALTWTTKEVLWPAVKHFAVFGQKITALAALHPYAASFVIAAGAVPMYYAIGKWTEKRDVDHLVSAFNGAKSLADDKPLAAADARALTAYAGPVRREISDSGVPVSQWSTARIRHAAERIAYDAAWAQADGFRENAAYVVGQVAGGATIQAMTAAVGLSFAGKKMYNAFAGGVASGSHIATDAELNAEAGISSVPLQPLGGGMRSGFASYGGGGGGGGGWTRSSAYDRARAHRHNAAVLHPTKNARYGITRNLPYNQWDRVPISAISGRLNRAYANNGRTARAFGSGGTYGGYTPGTFANAMRGGGGETVPSFSGMIRETELQRLQRERAARVPLSAQYNPRATPYVDMGPSFRGPGNTLGAVGSRSGDAAVAAGAAAARRSALASDAQAIRDLDELRMAGRRRSRSSSTPADERFAPLDARQQELLRRAQAAPAVRDVISDAEHAREANAEWVERNWPNIRAAAVSRRNEFRGRQATNIVHQRKRDKQPRPVKTHTVARRLQGPRS